MFAIMFQLSKNYYKINENLFKWHKIFLEPVKKLCLQSK